MLKRLETLIIITIKLALSFFNTLEFLSFKYYKYCKTLLKIIIKRESYIIL